MSGHSTLRPKGHVWITPEFGMPIEGDTLQCAHCGLHWIVQPGSGRKRGWCMNCNAPTCGQGKCDECIPVEKFLDCVERGIDPRNAPIKVRVPADVPQAHLHGGIVIDPTPKET